MENSVWCERKSIFKNQNLKSPAIFCSYAVWFVSYLTENRKDRSSYNVVNFRGYLNTNFLLITDAKEMGVDKRGVMRGKSKCEDCVMRGKSKCEDCDCTSFEGSETVTSMTCSYCGNPQLSIKP